MSVNMVKSHGRHAARSLTPAVVACQPLPGNSVAYVIRNGELAATAWSAGSNAGPRHLCSAFDLATSLTESRCSDRGYDCDCTVRLSTGSWVNGEALFVA